MRRSRQRRPADRRCDRVRERDTGSAMMGVIITVVATMGMAVGLLPAFSLAVLSPFVQEDLGISTAVVGVLPTMLFAVGAAASGLAGRTVDRVGPRWGLVLLFATAVGSWLLLANARAVGDAFVALGIAGLAMALAIPTTTRLLFAQFSGRPLGVTVGIAHAGTQLGAAAVGSLLPWLALSLGWRDGVRVTALVPALGLVLVALVRSPRSPARRTASSVDPSLRAAVRETPALVPLCAFALLVNAGATATVIYLPSFARQSVGLGVVAAGLVLTVMGTCSMVGKVAWGAATTRLTGTHSLAALLAGSLVAVSVMASAQLGGPALLWVGVALFGATATTWAVPTTRWAGSLSGAPRSGRASGVVMVAGYSGAAAGPLLYGQAVAASGYTLAWVVVLALFVTAGLSVRALGAAGR